MILENCIFGENIYLKCLNEEHVTDEYVKWLNDPKINEYMETRYRSWSLEDIKEYIIVQNQSKDQILFGIFLNSGKHIGNIKLGPTNFIHKLSSISLFIGDVSCHNKGYATQSIILLKDCAFGVLGLKKLMAGMYEKNISSLKAFLKAGFSLEGHFKDHYVLKNGIRTSVFQVGCTAP